MAEPGHVPVLLDETVEALSIRADGIYVDGTFGRGGHSRALLARLGPAGRLVGFDKDPEAVAVGHVLFATAVANPSPLVALKPLRL